MKDFAGKVAFITGGANGIGLGLAHAFIREGMKVIIADIEKAALDKAVAELGADARGMLVDVTDRARMAQAADEAEGLFGKIHVLCNNAGVSVGGPVASMDYKDWDWVLGVNLQGVINGLHTFLPKILAHGEGGYIVNTGSMAGHISNPGVAVYQATKYAVNGISEALAMELAELNVGVSVLSPAFVDTDIFSSARNRPDELCIGPESRVGITRADVERLFEERGIPLGRFATVDEVAALTVAAMKEGVLYIFPHPEMKAELQKRMDAVCADMDWATQRV